MNNDGLVLDLQKEILIDSNNATLLLRKAHLIATKLELSDMDSWILNELNGYSAYDEIPDYRNMHGECKAINPYNGLIPVILNSKLEKFLCYHKIPDSIANIEDLVLKGEDIMLSYPSEYQVLLNSNHPVSYQHVMYVSNISLKAIINHVKNFLLDWTLSLEKEKILGNDVSFSDKEITQAKAMSTTINNYYGTTNIVSDSFNGDNNNYTYNDYDKYIEEIRNCLAKEKISDSDKNIANKKIEIIHNDIITKKDDRVWFSLLIELKNFLIGVGASITANIIQKNFGI